MAIFSRLFRQLLFFGLIPALVCDAGAKTSDWLSAPKPKFPTEALKKGSEGSVKLQLVVDKEGHVVSSRIARSSGDPALDAAAQAGVAKWRMNPSAIKPSDLTSGRLEIVEFKQEAMAGAIYPDRRGYFEEFKTPDRLMYAPFRSYPLEERAEHHTGEVLIGAITDADGQVTEVVLLKSPGYHELDRCALAAVRLWRVHKQYAGKRFKVPIRFAMPGSSSRLPIRM
jgi:TonB family protein